MQKNTKPSSCITQPSGEAALSVGAGLLQQCRQTPTGPVFLQPFCSPSEHAGEAAGRVSGSIHFMCSQVVLKAKATQQYGSRKAEKMWDVKKPG